MACTPRTATIADTDPWDLLLAEARDHAARARALAGQAVPGGAVGQLEELLRAHWLHGVGAVAARLPNPQHRQDLAAALAAEAPAPAPGGRGLAAPLHQQLRRLSDGGSPAFALGMLALGAAPAGMWREECALPGTARALLSIAAVLARAAALRPELAAGMRAGAAVRAAFLQGCHRRGRVA